MQHEQDTRDLYNSILRDLLLGTTDELQQFSKTLSSERRGEVFELLRPLLGALRRATTSTDEEDRPRLTLSELIARLEEDHAAFIESDPLPECRDAGLFNRVQVLQTGLAPKREVTKGLSRSSDQAGSRGDFDMVPAVGRALVSRPEPWAKGALMNWLNHIDRRVRDAPRGLASFFLELWREHPEWHDDLRQRMGKAMALDGFRRGFAQRFPSDMIAAGLAYDGGPFARGYENPIRMPHVAGPVAVLAARDPEFRRRLVEIAADQLRASPSPSLEKVWEKLLDRLGLSEDEIRELRREPEPSSPVDDPELDPALAQLDELIAEARRRGPLPRPDERRLEALEAFREGRPGALELAAPRGPEDLSAPPFRPFDDDESMAEAISAAEPLDFLGPLVDRVLDGICRFPVKGERTRVLDRRLTAAPSGPQELRPNALAPRWISHVWLGSPEPPAPGDTPWHRRLRALGERLGEGDRRTPLAVPTHEDGRLNPETFITRYLDLEPRHRDPEELETALYRLPENAEPRRTAWETLLAERPDVTDSADAADAAITVALAPDELSGQALHRALQGGPSGSAVGRALAQAVAEGKTPDRAMLVQTLALSAQDSSEDADDSNDRLLFAALCSRHGLGDVAPMGQDHLDALVGLLAAPRASRRERAAARLAGGLDRGRILPSALAGSLMGWMRKTGADAESLDRGLATLSAASPGAALTVQTALESLLVFGVRDLPLQSRSLWLERLTRVVEQTGETPRDPRARLALEGLARSKDETGEKARAALQAVEAPEELPDMPLLVDALAALLRRNLPKDS